MPLESKNLEKLLQALPAQKILVVGDLMLDEFIWGKVSRISPEAPVPVVDVQKSTYYPGGAANVARNLCSFGLKPAIAGVIGNDEPGKNLVSILKEEGARTGSIVVSSTRPTTMKTRIIARQQQVVRVDRETRTPLTADERKKLSAEIEKEIPQHDAIIVEDYGKGAISQELASLIVSTSRKHNKVLAIDPNPNNPLDWSGATAIKPNRAEAFQSAGLPIADGDEALVQAVQILQKKWDVRYLLVTLGEEGMLLVENGAKPYHTPPRAREVFDVSGAGDTSIAMFTAALAAGATGIEATELANHAAGVVVGKLGTATLTLDELKESFARG